MSDLDDIRALGEEDATKKALRKALREIDKVRISRAELVTAVYEAAKDAALSATIPAVPKPPKDKRKADPEVAICLLADWQLGKRTPDYDSDVCAYRLRKYAEKVVRLIDYQRAHHPVKEARIYLLGDLIESEEIFPGQAHRIDASLYQQLFHGAALLTELVRTIAAVVEDVRVLGVIGNHGAIGGPIRRSYHPETNIDAMLYNIARGMVDEPRIDWLETFVDGERAWYATDDVFDKTWFLFHGDQIRSASFGIPWYGYQKRLLGWATSVDRFDYAASGHWHVPVRQQVNAITHWGAGSPESTNTFAQEHLASGGQTPSQWLIFQGAHGPTAEYLIRL